MHLGGTTLILNRIGESVDVRKCAVGVWHTVKNNFFQRIRQCFFDFRLRASTGETGVAIVKGWIESMSLGCAVRIERVLGIEKELFAAAGNKTITDRRRDLFANFFELISGAIWCIGNCASLLPMFLIWFLSLVSHTGIISCT